MALVDELEVEMSKEIPSYTSSTSTAFKGAIQEVIKDLTQQAILDGYEKKEDNFKFIVSKIRTNWVIVLLVFTLDQKDPKQYVETIPIR